MSVWLSWYGRDSNWPPRPTRSPPIDVLVEPPDGEKEVGRKAAQGSCRSVRTVLQRSKDRDREGERQVDEAVPSVRAIATVEQIRRAGAGTKSIGAIHLDDTSAINDLGDSIAVARSDRAHRGWLRRHRHPSGGLRGWSERHDQPELRESVHHNAVGERPRQTDIGDDQEHRSQQAPRSCAGLRPLLGKHVETTTRCVGPCGTSTAP